MSKFVFSHLIVLLAAFSMATSTVRADTVLITGANSGIGFELAKQYAADGWHVIATHRRNSIPDSLVDLSNQYENVQV
jgi:NAD(P)-dependent dehydrogenase (short-subunit alcohol dehydrogenase family)